MAESEEGAQNIVEEPLASFPGPKRQREKRPGFGRLCMCVIISYLSMCTCGRAREKHFHCHMVPLLTSIVYSELKQRVYLCASRLSYRISFWGELEKLPI